MKLLREISAGEWRRPSVIALVLANLVPVFGVVFFGWEIFPLIFLFWSENVIIGVFNVLKMLTANPASPASWVANSLSFLSSASTTACSHLFTEFSSLAFLAAA
jgi:hypothetical protein